MALSQIFADNALVRLARGDSGRGNLIVSMAGMKLGDRLLVVGLSEPRLLALLGAKVGLTGRACGVDETSALVDGGRRAAEREGVLVEVQQAPFGHPPFEADNFDVVVIRAHAALVEPAALEAAIKGATFVLRDGGRCLVVADAAPGGLRRLFGDRQPRLPGQAIVGALSKNYRGARLLADRDGILFAEAVYRH